MRFLIWTSTRCEQYYSPDEQPGVSEIPYLDFSSMIEVMELHPLTPDFSLGYKSLLINRALAQNRKTMAYVRIWVHCVWGTKNRTPYLTKEVLIKMIDHIKSNAEEKGVYIDILNGHREHVHCIISLNPDQTLAKVIQLIKGESSFWINRNKLTRYRFEWAVEYYGVSVSDSQLHTVRKYIENQEMHHKVQTCEEECNEMMVNASL